MLSPTPVNSLMREKKNPGRPSIVVFLGLAITFSRWVCGVARWSSERTRSIFVHETTPLYVSFCSHVIALINLRRHLLLTRRKPKRQRMSLTTLQIRPFTPFPIKISRHAYRTNTKLSFKALPKPLQIKSKSHETHHDFTPQTKTQENGIPIEDVKIIAKFKSRYNYIRVLEISRKADHPFAGSRLLLLDAPGNIHSISFLFKSLTNTYFDVFAALPPIIPPGPIAILGFGAGSAARLLLELYPGVVVHGWELDPSVIDVGREFFGLKKLEKQYPDRLFIYVGNALSAEVKDGFSGILVDLFCKGSLIPELQDPNTWEKLRKSLRKDGRIMVNVGGSCVEAEDKRRDGKVVMEDTLKAMHRVFGDRLSVLNLGNRKDDSSLALTGRLPDLDAWKKVLPRSLSCYVDMWRPLAP